MTVDEIYQLFLDEVGETDAPDVKAKFRRGLNRTNRNIQAFAGVEKVWTVNVVAGTETYATGLTDVHEAWWGQFLTAGFTEEVANYVTWKKLNEYDFGKTGFFLNQAKTLYARPKPSTAGTLKVYGEKILSNLDFVADVGTGEVSTPEIEAQFHDIYVWDACRRYGSQDEDTEGAGSRYVYFTGEYMRVENAMLQRYTELEQMRKDNNK